MTLAEAGPWTTVVSGISDATKDMLESSIKSRRFWQDPFILCMAIMQYKAAGHV